MKTAIAGYVLLAVTIGVFIARRGTHWTWGRLGMPEPILDANGVAVDGIPDPVNHLLIRTGYYQEMMWCVVAVVAGLFVLLVREIVRSSPAGRAGLEALREFRKYPRTRRT